MSSISTVSLHNVAYVELKDKGREKALWTINIQMYKDIPNALKCSVESNCLQTVTEIQSLCMHTEILQNKDRGLKFSMIVCKKICTTVVSYLVSISSLR